MKPTLGLAALLVGLLPAATLADSPKPASCPEEHYTAIPKGAIKVALPDIQQPDDLSCGVAALMSILAYYGAGPEDYDVLRKKLGTTKNGTDYKRMVGFAQRQGLHAEARPEMKWDDLQRELDAGTPVICSIQAYDGEKHTAAERRKLYKDENENGHYVVAIGYDEKNIYFMDPSLTGRRGYLPRDEFEERWHDNEGTEAKPDVIHHLGLVIWKDEGGGANARCARKID